MEEVALPPNWRAAKDSDGKEYYFNELTGETSWVVPQADAVQQSGAADVEEVAVEDDSEFAPPREGNGPHSMMSVPDYGGDSSGKRPRSSSYYAELEGLIGESVLPRLVIVCVCSFIVMLQSAVELSKASSAGLDTGPRSYGVACGTISLAFSLGLLIFAKLKPSVFANFVIPRLPGELSIMQLFAAFLVAWWIPGMIVLTFFNPFTTTENSYFAAWVALIASLLILGDQFQRVGDKFRELSQSRIHSDAPAKSLVGFCLACVIVFCSCLEYVGEGVGQATFGMIVAIVSAILAALVYWLTEKGKIGAPQ